MVNGVPAPPPDNVQNGPAQLRPVMVTLASKMVNANPIAVQTSIREAAQPSRALCPQLSEGAGYGRCGGSGPSATSRACRDAQVAGTPGPPCLLQPDSRHTSRRYGARLERRPRDHAIQTAWPERTSAAARSADQAPAPGW